MSEQGDDVTVIDALILAGGTGRRLGGVDKAALRLGDLPLLDHVLDAVLPVARRIVVVGPPRPVRTTAAIRWTLEEPAGGGPLAGFGAGLDALADSDPPDPDRWVLTLACDLPFARQAVGPLLNAIGTLPSPSEAGADPGPDALLGLDPDGYVQSLMGAYRFDRTRRALSEHGPLTGGSMRRFVSRLSIQKLALPRQASHDVDTPADMTELGVTGGAPRPGTPPGIGSRNTNGEPS